MASHPSNCNCPKCSGHHPAKKHDTSKCPVYTEFPQITFKRGAGAERDVCTFAPKAGVSGSDSRLGWQDIYRCHLGHKPSASLVSKYGKIPSCPYSAPPAGTSGAGSVPGADSASSGQGSGSNQCADLLPFGSSSTSKIVEVSSGSPDSSVSQEECRAYASEQGNHLDGALYRQASNKSVPTGCIKSTNNYVYYIDSGADNCAINSEYSCVKKQKQASDGTPALLNDIKYFQDQEMLVLEQLQQESVKPNPNEAEITAQTTLLATYQDARVRLMQQLKNISSQTQCSLASDRTALQDQLAMMMLAEDQLKTTEKQTQELINERNNKHRMIEITNYEYDRYSSHKDIFRTIAFCSLFVLAGIYIGASGNNTFRWIGYPMVVVAIAVAIFLTIKKIWWNYYRNERNWKQFEWDDVRPQGRDYETVWQHDKKAFEKAWAGVEDEAGSLEKDTGRGYRKATRDAKKAYNEGKKAATGAAEDANKTSKNQLTSKSTGKRESFAPFR